MTFIETLPALFQAQLANHPLLLFAACLAMVSVAQRAGLARRAIPERVMLGAAIAGLAFYAGQVVAYVVTDGYYDHAEPSMASVSWVAMQGQPLYHELGSAERYAHVYGPWAFIVPGTVLLVLGPSLAASKAAGAGAGLMTLVISFFLLRRTTTFARAVGGAAVVAVGLLMFRNYAFWNRPDSLLAFGVSAAMLSAMSKRAFVRELGVGVSLGFMAGLKITAPLYGLAAVALLFEAGGWKSTVRMSIVAIVVWGAPYVWWPHADLRLHAEWLALAASSGVTTLLLAQNAAWAAFLALPLLYRWWRGGARPDRPSLALLSGMAGIVVLAAKPGSGPYHLLPFIPALVWLDAFGGVRNDVPTVGHSPDAWRRALLVTGMVLAAGSQAYFLAGLHRTEWREASRELRALLAAQPASAQVGYADAGPLSYLRALAVFRSGRYQLDTPAVQEHQRAGVEIPDTTVDRFRRCETPVWILPRGEPFSAVNAYPQTGHRRLFPESFRTTFLSHYSRKTSGRYYDVWVCK
jgi:hypothetical protein